jgi:hypothetical protein
VYVDSSYLAADLDSIQGELCAELEPDGALAGAIEYSILPDLAALLDSALCAPDSQLRLSDLLAIVTGEGASSDGYGFGLRSLAAKALHGGVSLKAAYALGKAFAKHPAALAVLPDLVAALSQGGAL